MGRRGLEKAWEQTAKMLDKKIALRLKIYAFDLVALNLINTEDVIDDLS